jgi:hypothetical protein
MPNSYELFYKCSSDGLYPPTGDETEMRLIQVFDGRLFSIEKVPLRNDIKLYKMDVSLDKKREK